MYRDSRFSVFCRHVLVLAAILLVGTGAISAQSAVPTAMLPISFDGLQTRELQIDLGDGWTSKAELTWPAQGSGPFPTVILFHGSAPSDMDETSFQNPGDPIFSANFRLLAQQLGMKGIAVLRFNKRGVKDANTFDNDQVGKSFTLARIMADGESVIATALEQPEVDAKRLYLYGWSYGSIEVSQLAVYHPELSGLILQGAVNQTVRDGDNYQLQEVQDYLREVVDSSKDGQLSLDELKQLPATGLVFWFSQGFYDSTSTPDHPVLSNTLDTNHDGLIALRDELVPYFRAATESDVANNLDYNVPLTADVLAHLQLPVLLLAGDHDGLVSPNNSAAIAQELGTRATLKLYPGLGHGLSKTAIPAEDVPLMMEQQPIDDMAAWILATK